MLIKNAEIKKLSQRLMESTKNLTTDETPKILVNADINKSETFNKN